MGINFKYRATYANPVVNNLFFVPLLIIRMFIRIMFLANKASINFQKNIKLAFVLFKDIFLNYIDVRTGRILWRKFIFRKETIADYVEGFDWLVSQGFNIDGIVCDGLRGMFQVFSKYRVQMCQFHQVAIVKRYLTNKPELATSIELLKIVKLMCHTDKDSFVGLFEEWQYKWNDFLKERNRDKKTRKSYYVHKRLRSAYLSLRRNMPYLWTWYDNIEIGIPNTNNGLEGKFTDLKSKLRNHNGLSQSHRMVFIDEYFKASFQSECCPIGQHSD